jgi:hypothetical protein
MRPTIAAANRARASASQPHGVSLSDDAGSAAVVAGGAESVVVVTGGMGAASTVSVSVSLVVTVVITGRVTVGAGSVGVSVVAGSVGTSVVVGESVRVGTVGRVRVGTVAVTAGRDAVAAGLVAVAAVVNALPPFPPPQEPRRKPAPAARASAGPTASR